MKTFQHPLWGFEFTYPDDWVHAVHEDKDGFAPDAAAFAKADYAAIQAAHLLVRGEWNGYREPIAPRWNQYISKLAIMLGAKQLGSAPFRMGGASGFEAELRLPRKLNRRLWVGILARDAIILHLTVSHPLEIRETFEPLATQIISSLRFLDRVENLTLNRDGIPLPPDYAITDPISLVPDLQNGENWRAYTGSSDIGALQAFYYRELPTHGWEIQEFIPWPNQVDIDFVRLRIHKDDFTATLGILPSLDERSTGQIVIRQD